MKEKLLKPYEYQDMFLEEIKKKLRIIEEKIQKSRNLPIITKEEIKEIFGMVHGIKGLAVMLDDMSLAEMIHSVENLFYYMYDTQNLKKEQIDTAFELGAVGTQFIKMELMGLYGKNFQYGEYGYEVIDKIMLFLDNTQGYDTNNLYVPLSLYKKEDALSFEDLYKKVKRMVDIMNHTFHKNAVIQLKGQKTSVNKQTYELVSMAVLQMVKNSIDHGIESNEQRIKNGKDIKSHIEIDISKTPEGVIVSVSDDGRGIIKQEILWAAKKQGILTKPANEYTDNEIYRFIFASGFTTKESANLFSGRGIGLDTVNTSIVSCGGFIIVDNEENKGCRFIISIPEF